MPCFNPLKAQVTEAGDVRLGSFDKVGDVRSIDLRCGRCHGCKTDRAREWTVRCIHESKLYDKNSFVTLTYDDEHLPEYSSLRYRDFQLFMKRLRKNHAGVRFFCAGEYGEVDLRPHYHAILFNFDLNDKYRFGKRGYRSEELERLWPLGNSKMGDVTFESIGYVCGYVMKKIYGREADSYYNCVDPATGEIASRVPEFVQMSLKPGIGSAWFNRYESDFRNGDFVVQNGSRLPMPAYYRRKLPEEVRQKFEEERELFFGRMDPGERSDERLEVREEVAVARRNFHTKPRA